MAATLASEQILGDGVMMVRLAIVLVWVAVSAGLARADGDWRTVSPENLILIDTAYGRVTFELAPAFAPEHAARMRALVRAKFYDGQSFYRV
ncbi:MAG TPA: hypothetical protein DCL48_06430, partial [Alphaproteobacteria bacterium]|nr:hypothetical protein [Alphaproteobacteria bacterium]